MDAADCVPAAMEFSIFGLRRPGPAQMLRFFLF